MKNSINPNQRWVKKKKKTTRKVGYLGDASSSKDPVDCEVDYAEDQDDIDNSSNGTDADSGYCEEDNDSAVLSIP